MQNTKLKQLEEKLRKVIPANEISFISIIFDSSDENDISLLMIKTKYGETLNFYENGKVKCYDFERNTGIIKGHCRYLLDILMYKEEIIHEGTWNKEEKCGYWNLI